MNIDVSGDQCLQCRSERIKEPAVAQNCSLGNQVAAVSIQFAILGRQTYSQASLTVFRRSVSPEVPTRKISRGGVRDFGSTGDEDTINIDVFRLVGPGPFFCDMRF